MTISSAKLPQGDVIRISNATPAGIDAWLEWYFRLLVESVVIFRLPLFGDWKFAENVYKVVFLCFTVIGASVSLGPVIVFTDSVFFLPAICNGIGLYLLAKVIRGDFDDYWQKLRAGDFARVTSAGHPPPQQRHVQGRS